MSDAYDQDGELLVDGFVDDSVASHAKPSQTSEFALEGRTSRWLVGQSVDRFDQASPLRDVDSPESLRGATLDLDRVGHV